MYIYSRENRLEISIRQQSYRNTFRVTLLLKKSCIIFPLILAIYVIDTNYILPVLRVDNFLFMQPIPGEQTAHSENESNKQTLTL